MSLGFGVGILLLAFFILYRVILIVTLAQMCFCHWWEVGTGREIHQHKSQVS